jgi:hypothetical protein
MISHKMIKNILLITVVILASGLYAGCSFTVISFRALPDPPCPIESLLLDVSLFPGEGWEETGSRTERGAPSRLGIERIGTSFSTPTKGGANQDVYRFWDAREARKGYRELVNSWFSPQAGYSEWATPPDLANLLTHANQDQLACSVYVSGQVEWCQYIAQYQPYVIKLSADMLAISHEDFIELVKEIDRRATSCLEQ